MKTLAIGSASAKVYMILDRHSPIWSMAPFGAFFSVVLLTAAITLPLWRQRQNDRSSIDRKAFDFYLEADVRRNERKM